MEIILVIIVCTVMLALLGGYLWIVSWAIGDAQKRGHGGGLVVLLFWLFGPLAALIWLVTRPKETLFEQRPESYDDPEDAMAAASRLDSLGDWSAASKLYQSIGERWPEHSEYVGNCLADVRRKQASLDPQTEDGG
jgi:hypothetical protein